jgi:hypothetical protein
MNSTNTPAILRSLIVYALCVPLAVWLGFMLADPFDRATFSYFGIMTLLLLTPILLRWHQLLLVAIWNLKMTVFFLPGAPALWLPMILISFGISVLHRAVNSQARFISAPQITRPLILLLAVVFFTAELTGGFGMKSLGNESVVGGKRYIFLIVAILGFFALTAKQIPTKRAGLFVGLFFCGSCAGIIGDLYGKLPSSLNFIFAFFPASSYTDTGDISNAGARVTRLAGLGYACLNIALFMMARYGIRGIFMSGRPWRTLAFALFAGLILLGGFRAWMLHCLVVFTILFFMERLYRTQLLMILFFLGLSMAVLIVPFSDKLPLSAQRTLSVIPFLKIDPIVLEDAQASSDWRVRMWEAVLPQVPDHLLLGKGYSITTADLNMVNLGAQFDAANNGSAIASDYHNGPLSVVLTFGIWGGIAVIWFWIASLRALIANYRYGDPSLQTYNALFLAYFIMMVFMFLFLFGSLYSDMFTFTGIIGLSISLNGGIRRPVAAPMRTVNKTSDIPLARPRFQPFYQS